MNFIVRKMSVLDNSLPLSAGIFSGQPLKANWYLMIDDLNLAFNKDFKRRDLSTGSFS